jgi:ABC-type metal ion transport system substrate-binding protein
LIKIAKVALGNKTTNFGISCKLLPKDSVITRKTNFILFPSTLKKITEPLRKIKVRINDF